MAKPPTERERGAAWRIWDLHVHTPASIVQHYGGDTDVAWDRFLDELETLPEDITVLGINDYWFLDGYRRIVQAREAGRLQNLEAIFPVVEMRLDHFGGTAGNLSRVNLHVVFDPELSANVIEAQFINALQPKLTLAPGHNSLGWQGVITRDSLEDLGRRIKQSVPTEELPKYGTDLQEGFNNLNVRLDDVLAALEGPFFKGRALIGIGKTEWNAIKWNEQSIAAKKNVINSAQFLFTAYDDTSRWLDDVNYLRSSNVTCALLDCSDAHNFADSGQSMRLGACQTWMNTTPTLAGLAYAIEEFDRRVFVGLEPPALARIRRNPERFIERVRVTSTNPKCDLFAHDLPLNAGFVAVVGNKGQGKSALLDCIALAGNSSRNNEFAFLRSSRFLSASNQKVAREYTAELVWATGASRSALLNEAHDKSVPVSVEYLPQMFVERVCNLEPDDEDADEFERELRAVLFTHIPEEERAGERSFDALLAQTTKTSREDIQRHRDALRSTLREYMAIAAFRANNQALEVQGRLDLKRKDLEDAFEALAEAKAALEAVDAESGDDGELNALRAQSEDIEQTRTALLQQRASAEHQLAQTRQDVAAMAAIRHRAEAIRSDMSALNAEAERLLADAQTFVSVSINEPLYDRWSTAKHGELADLTAEHERLVGELQAHETARRLNAEALAAADGARERARQRVLQLQDRVSSLVGDENDEESLEGLETLLQRIGNAPVILDRLREEIGERSHAVYQALVDQLEAVKGLYAPASEFIAHSDVVRNAGLEFSAELRLMPSWRSVAVGLDGRRNGDFSEWFAELPQRVEDSSWGQLWPQLREGIVRLEHERGDSSGEFRNPATALRSTTTLEDFLTGMFDLSWMEVRFGLTGDGLPLSQLSPGQRGLVLALFYLVVDRRATPLLLDQPEENLDNETIASKLVPAIHEAAGRRQTIVVTHNANLAVVGDADQIVHCQLTDGRFTLSSGSIAELDVARFALDVLEGTKPAFDNRRHKYEAFPELA